MDYTAYLNEVRDLRTENTYENYKFALAKFPNPTPAAVRNYIRKSKDCSSTKKNRLRILKMALDYYGKLTKEMARIIKGYRENVSVEPCPTDEQVERAWNALATSRDRAMFALMAYNGLRIGEVNSLNRADVDREHDCLIVRGTKGKRDAIIPIIHERVKKNLYAWMNEDKSRDKALFTGPNGRLSYGYMKNMFRRVFLDAGFPEFHAHSLRRYYANSMYNAGVPVQDMMVSMRHASINTTMRYLNLGQQNVIAALQRTWQGHTA